MELGLKNIFSMSLLSIFVSILFLNYPHTAIADDNQLLSDKIFSPLIHPDFLQAEQGWVAKAPRTSGITFMKAITDPLVRLFASSEMKGMMQRTGDLPREYRPEMQRVFDLPMYYVDPDLMFEIGVRPFSTDLALWTVHPYTLNSVNEQATEIKEWITRYNEMISLVPMNVQATPTASNRSLFAIYQNSDGQKDWSIFKTSSHLWSSGSRRTISKTQAVRAVIVSQIYQELYNKTKGVLPISGVTWSFFPETYASIPKNLEHLGFVHRSKPLNLPSNVVPIAAYSVNVREENGRKWIDNVLGDLDKKTFREATWNTFIRPAWELMLTMTFVHGAAPELHGQNLHYLKNVQTGKVVGVSYLDTSSHISKEIRLANGLSSNWKLPGWVSEKDLGFHKSASEIEGAIAYFDTYLLDYVFGLRLDSEDMNWIHYQQLSFLRTFVDYYKQILGPLNASSKKYFIIDIMDRIKKYQEVIAAIPKKIELLALNDPSTEKHNRYSEMEKIIVAESRALTQDEISLYPHPVTLAEEEVTLLQRASSQKLNTLMAFIEDVRSGSNTWTKVIPPAVLRSLNGGKDLHGNNWPRYFPYAGIDFVRDEKTGKFKTLEVQLNPIPAGTYYLDLMLNLLRRFDVNLDRDKQYGLFATIAKSMSKVNKGNIFQPTIVLLDYNVLGVANSFSKEMEINNLLQKRNAELMKEYGIYLVTVDHLDFAQSTIEKCTGICLNILNNKANFIYADGSSTRLAIRDDQLFLEILQANKVIETKQVNYLWNHIDPKHFENLAGDVKRVIESGKVFSNHHPAIALLANKGFQAYLDQLTKHYLREDPLVTFPRTDLFIDSDGNLNPGKLNELIARPAAHYLKPTVGFGGSGVFAGDQHISRLNEFENILNQIRKNPSHFITQEAIGEISTIPPSSVNSGPLQMEMRFFAIASSTGEITTTSAALGRLASVGSKLNNLGRHTFSKTPNLAISIAGPSHFSTQEDFSTKSSAHIARKLIAPHADFKPTASAYPYLETVAADQLVDEHPLSLLLEERPDLQDSRIRLQIAEEMRFANKNTLALNPIPLTLQENTYANLRRSSQQRSQAILLFLQDYFSHGSKWKTVIPEDIFSYILQKTPLDEDSIVPEDLAFINGVDYLRDSDGKIFVIEDNLVAAAGLYTNQQILSEMDKIAPNWSKKHISHFNDLQIIKDHYAKISGKKNPLIVTLHYNVDLVSTFGLSDFADRVAQNQRFFAPLLRKNGIEIVTISAMEREINRITEDYLGIDLFTGDSTTGLTFGARKRLIKHQDGSIWLETRSEKDSFLTRPAQKVDVIISGLTPKHFHRWLRPLTQAHQSKQLILSHTGGIELLDNKLAQVYVNKMIKVFLGERPIFPSPRCIIFVDKNGELNTKMLHLVFDDLDKWYLKESVNSLGGGSGIYPGGDLISSPMLKAKVLKALRADPYSFIAVKKVAGSISWGLGSEVARQVDFRATTLANSHLFTPLSSLYSRGAPMSQGKLNSTGKNKFGTHQLVISFRPKESGSESCETNVRKIL